LVVSFWTPEYFLSRTLLEFSFMSLHSTYVDFFLKMIRVEDLSEYTPSFFFYLEGLGSLARAHSELTNSEIFILYTDGNTPWVTSPSHGRYLHRTTQTQNERRHACLEWDSNLRSQTIEDI
jgi:hypothetical protein